MTLFASIKQLLSQPFVPLLLVQILWPPSHEAPSPIARFYMSLFCHNASITLAPRSVALVYWTVIRVDRQPTSRILVACHSSSLSTSA